MRRCGLLQISSGAGAGMGEFGGGGDGIGTNVRGPDNGNRGFAQSPVVGCKQGQVVLGTDIPIPVPDLQPQTHRVKKSPTGTGNPVGYSYNLNFDESQDYQNTQYYENLQLFTNPNQEFVAANLQTSQNTETQSRGNK
ncbi:hypothetical protein LXL04_014171 [Taraxacum kok-saghyz]